MTEWEPATDAEVAMRNALRTDDQESYFRILAGVDLLLPVSAEALAGRAPMGWGTWSTGGRTHVLAFTSPEALQACLSDYPGSARQVAYAELAETWPNLEWWLAVNPGLPIEGYLPAWFVAQLSRGDLRLPTRGPAREDGDATSRIMGMQAAAASQSFASPASGGPVSAGQGNGDRSSNGAGDRFQDSPADPYQRASAATDPYQRAAADQPQRAAADQPQRAADQPQRAAADLPQRATPPSPQRGGYDTAGGQSGKYSPTGGQGGEYTGAAGGMPGALPSRTAAPAAEAGQFAGGGGAEPVGPGGLPVRSPGGVLPSGLPSRVPATPPGMGGPGGSSFSGFTTGGAAQNRVQDAEPASGQFAPVRPESAPAGLSGPESAPGTQQHVSPPSDASSGAGRSAVTPGSALDALASRSGSTAPAGSPSALDSLGSRSGTPASAPSLPPLQSTDGPLPTRTPMAQTPPVPDHMVSPEQDDVVGGASGAAADSESVEAVGPAEQAGPGGLPRRQVASPAERPVSMAAAAQELTARGQAGAVAPGSSEDPAQPPREQGLAAGSGGAVRAGIAPPVIPGADGADRSMAASGSDQSAAAQRASGSQPQLPTRTPGGSAAPDAGGLPTRPVSAPSPAATTSPPPTTSPDSSPAASENSSQAASDSSSPAARAETIPAANREARSEPNETERQAAAVESGTGRELAVRNPHGDTQRPQDEDEFVPANEVERNLYHASLDHSTDAFLSTLLLATVLVPVGPDSRPGSAPGESGFVFRTEEFGSERFLVVFTSRDRLAEHYVEPARTVAVRFVELIKNWPDPAWAFAVNPGSAVGARYPGPQVIALASWAVEAGLGEEPADSAPDVADDKAAPSEAQPTTMQKMVPAEQVDYYLERGYDRVAGFVHRAAEVEHLRSPHELFAALGLLHDGSPYSADAKEAFLLRWPAFRPSLYRIPYGGQNEQALRAMDGWVIERAPFRGNGFAPGEGSDVIAEFKVDSVRLPHGAQLWRLDADGGERVIAVFDCDAPIWRRVGDDDA